MAQKYVRKTTFDSTLANQKTGKTIGKPLKELPWNQQINLMFHYYFNVGIFWLSRHVQSCNLRIFIPSICIRLDSETESIHPRPQ